MKNLLLSIRDGILKRRTDTKIGGIDEDLGYSLRQVIDGLFLLND